VVFHVETDVVVGANGKLHLLLPGVRELGHGVAGAVLRVEHDYDAVEYGLVDQFHAGAVELVVLFHLVDQPHVEEVGVVFGEAVGRFGPHFLDVFEFAGLQSGFVEVECCNFVDFAVVPHFVADELV